MIEGFLTNAAPAPLLNPLKKEEEGKTSVYSKNNDKADLFTEPEKKKADTSSISHVSGGSSSFTQAKPEEKSTTDKHIEKAHQMLEEQKREEKSGYHFGGRYGSSAASATEAGKPESRKREEDVIDTYGDDFEEEIDEEIAEDNNGFEAHDVGGNKGVTESAGGITVSQSLGVDPSVDSLALEDYDHIEPVERIM